MQLMVSKYISNKRTIFIEKITWILYHLYTNTLLDGYVILFVRYRNHFPVVQFQYEAHILNPHGPAEVLKILWGAVGAPIFIIFFNAAEGGEFRRSMLGAPGAPNVGHRGAPNFFYFTAAEGGCFASIRIVSKEVSSLLHIILVIRDKLNNEI